MAIYKHNPAPNPVVRVLRLAYNPVGFQKGYNAILFFIFGGAFFAFGLSRVQYLDVWGFWAANNAPGETWAYLGSKLYKITMHIHLITCIPACWLATLQFVPVIRHKFILFHRLNGYVCILLLLFFSVTSIIASRVAFGGDITTQGVYGALGLAVILSTFLAYFNVKRLQIEQHRAWMLRAWFYAGSIVTLRFIQPLVGILVSNMDGFYRSIPCEQIASVNPKAALKYPNCAADMSSWTAVKMNLADPNGVDQAMAALQGGFGVAGLLAFLMHAVGVEIYLRLTPAEGERLRQVSYERQVERGFKHAGSAGTTADRLGDAEWKPKANSDRESAAWTPMVPMGSNSEAASETFKSPHVVTT